jgi:single-strand DNA-binding protein
MKKDLLPAPINEVYLRGRVTGEGVAKVLPSGDQVVEFRIVVPRTDSGVDTLDMAVWSATLRKKALSLHCDEWVEVAGEIRRRFWQTGSGVASRTQIEVATLSRIKVG